MTTEQALEFEDPKVEEGKPNGSKGRRIKTCKCGILHTGYYGDTCAVCMVYKRAGVDRHEAIGVNDSPLSLLDSSGACESLSGICERG